MQDPNEDSQWNDILRAKGIIPSKQKEISEDEVVNILEATIAQKQSTGEKPIEKCSLDELDELEDDEDEHVLLEYRNKRIAEMKALAVKSKYGVVSEITAQEYVQEVNKAGDGVWVILHLYKPGIPLCSLVNQYLNILANKFPMTKFIRSISSLCIPNFPDKNLPTIFVYFEGELKKQYAGPFELRGMNLTVEELEWMLGEAGALPTEITQDPKPKVKDVMFSRLRGGDDTNDWEL